MSPKRLGRLFRTSNRLLLVVGFSLFISNWAAAQQSCPWPGLTGSFLQPALGDQWTPTQWDQELDTYMSAACLDQLVLQWSADSKAHTTVYPTNLTVAGYTYSQNTTHDVLGRALSHGDTNGVHVYVGLQTNADWFTNYANNSSWLNNEATIAKALASDIWSKYGSHTSFAGWYLTFEVDNLNEQQQTQWDNLVSFYTTVGSYLHSLAPGKPIIIAPFFNANLGSSAETPAQWTTMWEYILSRSPLDILALQDGIGAGHATVSQLPTWYQATQTAICTSAPGMKFWSDAETYVVVSGFHPMFISTLVADMNAEAPYVSNFLSFSFNHYMSPQQVNPVFDNTYLGYLSTQTVETTPPTAPTSLSATAVNSLTVNLSWNASTDNVGIAGYQVYRNGVLVITLYQTSTSYSDTQLDPSTSYTYQLVAFDGAGNFSASSNQASATTPAGNNYPTDLALGKSYSATLAASSSYPDTNGTELTNGAFGAPVYTDAAWQGRLTGSVYAFTIDLGASQTIHEITSDWLQYQSVSIYLPQTVTYLVSNDNVNWTSVGQVNTPAVGNAPLSKQYRVTDLTNVTARYVQVQVLPASASWTFIDEVQVLQ
jgi:chitodextrinase